MLFSCAALRSLTLACCRFALPATVSLPSVETLLLSHVNGPDSDVQRLVSGCPRLADLSIVACRALTAVTVLGARLRRLAILCSDSLAAVAVDASELRHFEYSGFVPDGRNFLTLHGDAQRRRGMAYCKVNICGAEATSEYKLTHLRQFLQLFAADAEHLQLESARLGAGADKDASVSFPTFPNLRRLELWGRLPDKDAAAAAAALATVNRILTSTPELESLALGFHSPAYSRSRRESQDCPEELLSGQQLRYNPHGRGLAAAPQAPCLRSTVRELSLVHYQGGVAQRSLARFVLRSAPAIAEVYCGCAEGDWSTLSQLKREIIGWVMNKSANTIFA
ncbi:uncharacterized protein LOC121055690 [Oryza brachyantha]|uniref:uncharacterized protein LOC121055690 n=1 Tax=Oryza brachyantha TaxID=4533 RepID=UPI001ADD1EC6|nr:uncharacterized protein LOC121055690 [Oryza brachyantha]